MTDATANEMSEESAVDLIMQRLEAGPPKDQPAKKEQAQPATAETPDQDDKGGDDVEADGEQPEADTEELDLDALEDDEAEAKKAQPVKAETPKAAQVAQPQVNPPQANEAARTLQQLQTMRNQMVYDPLVAQGANPEFWTKLAADDPLEWPKVRAEYEARVQKLRQVDQAIGDLTTQEETRILSEQRAKLIEKFPEFNDPETYKKFTQEAVTVLVKDYGFQKEEIDALNDHRAVSIIRDAMKYRQAVKAKQSAKTSAQAKEVKPEATAVLKPQAKAVQSQQSEVFKRLKAQALRTGREDDRMNAVLAALGR